MKIGIFECGYVPESLQNDFISYPDMLIRSFNNINCKFEYSIYDVTKNHFPENIDECDAYIMTGSSHSVNDEYSWIAKLEEIVRKCQKHQKKLIGICFGHQLLAKALGGKVEQSKAGWGIGLIENRLLQYETWLIFKQAEFNMIVSHEDQVVKIPEGATLLASNDHCANFMIKFGDKLLGIQGHPEFDNDFIRALMKARADIIPENILEAGYDSLSKTSDNLLVMQWITHFLGTNIRNKSIKT